MNQLERLQHLETTHDLTDFDDEPADTTEDDLPANPVAAEFDKAEFERAGGPPSWNDETAPEGNALAKRDTRSEYVKNHYTICEPFGSAALVKAARTETTNGWEYVYDSNNELVSGRQINNDGGPLSKRSGEEDSTVDLSKAASPGMVRFEHTTIDNEPWVMGWNDKGENVYAAPLEDHKQIHQYSDETLEV